MLYEVITLNSNDMTKIDGTGNDGAEIDIFEAFGWSDIIHHTVHWDGYGKDHKSTVITSYSIHYTKLYE